MKDPGRLRLAVAQMNSHRPVADNLASMVSTVAECAAAGVEMVVFPENATLLAPDDERIAAAETLSGLQVSTVREAAARHGVGIVLGSISEVGPDPGRTYNTCVAIAPDGEIVGVYRKMHLFDVDVSEDTRFRESETVAAGPPAPVCVELLGWRVGLSICYDLRFPELYRALAANGAEILAVPAAFTLRTGLAHWHPLLRARAIENTCYVAAAAQVGPHYGRRESFGHALVASPWGTVLAEVDSGEGWVAGELDRARLQEVRAAIPSLRHRRM